MLRITPRSLISLVTVTGQSFTPGNCCNDAASGGMSLVDCGVICSGLPKVNFQMPGCISCGLPGGLSVFAAEGSFSPNAGGTSMMPDNALTVLINFLLFIW